MTQVLIWGQSREMLAGDVQAAYDGDPAAIFRRIAANIQAVMRGQEAAIRKLLAALTAGEIRERVAHLHELLVDQAADQDILLLANTNGITATGSGIDFIDLVDEMVIIKAGTTSATVTVPTTDDSIDEPDNYDDYWSALGERLAAYPQGPDPAGVAPE